MINLTADKNSWQELLSNVAPQQRFYSAKDIDPALAESNGMPILMEIGSMRIHIYPPERTGDWAGKLIKENRDA